VLVEALTDNRNRTVSEVRHVFSKAGGSLGDPGCVSYLFEKKGLIVFGGEGLDGDALMEAALEAGADDVLEADQTFTVVTAPGDFEPVRESLTSGGFVPVSAEITLQPTSTVRLVGKEAEAMLKVADALEDLDDIQAVHANFDIPDEVMAELASGD